MKKFIAFINGLYPYINLGIQIIFGIGLIYFSIKSWISNDSLYSKIFVQLILILGAYLLSKNIFKNPNK